MGEADVCLSRVPQTWLKQEFDFDHDLRQCKLFISERDTVSVMHLVAFLVLV